MVAPAVAIALITSGCGANNGTSGAGAGSGGGSSSGSTSGGSVKIGMSLPLTGQFSQPGTSSERGYKIWQSTINKSGGLRGKQVKLDITDDASSQKTVVTDYQKLISQDHVNLLLGTFSSLLNLPASAIAAKNNMLYVEPSGGAEEMFTRGFKQLFFAQEATAPHQGDQLAKYVCGLPPSKKPKTAAYVSIDDPFAEPVIAGLKPKLQACGIKTVHGLQTFPANTTDFSSIVDGIKRSNADIVLEGAVFPDAVGIVRQMKESGYNPKLLFQTSAPSEGSQYSKAIGLPNTQGVFYAVSWDAHAATPGNAAFVKQYEKLYHGTPPEDAADAFATAQVLEAAVKGTGSFDQDKLAEWLHGHSVDTVEGKLSWSNTGAPTGQFLLAQWQNGQTKIVEPSSEATSKTVVYPKPNWK